MIANPLSRHAICLAVIVGLSPASAQTTLYEQSLTPGEDTAGLNGTSPTIGANNWVASPLFQADGDIAEGAGSATLAFTPVDGFIYTVDASFRNLSPTASVANPEQDWVAVGFAKGQSAIMGTNNRFLNNHVIGKAWMLFRGDNSANANNAAHLGSATVANSSSALWSDATLIEDTTGSNDVVIDISNPSQAAVVGNILTLTPPANLAFNTDYEVVIGPNTIEDTASIPNAFPGTTAGQWTFSTAAQGLTAPVITLKSPLDNAIEVSRATNIVATCDDDILVGKGNITLKDLADDSTTQVIPVSDSSQVSISGKVLTIDPTSSLAVDRSYAVQISAGAVKNFSDVDFAGIPANDDTTWNFETLDTSPNVIFILGDDQGWYDYSFM